MKGAISHPGAAGPHQGSFEQVPQGKGCRWAVLRRKGDPATREGGSVTNLCSSARPSWRAGFSPARGGLPCAPAAADSGSLLSRCGHGCPALSIFGRLYPPPPTHTHSQAREGAHLQATEIVWPLGARLTLVRSCLRSKAGDLSPFSPVGRVLAPCCYPATVGVVFPW